MKLFWVFMLCTVTVFAQDDQDEHNILTRGNYSIEYPADWEVDTAGTSGTQFILFAPADEDDDAFSENVNMMIQDGPIVGKMTLEDISRNTIEDMKRYFTDVKLLRNDVKTTTGREHLEMVYTANRNGMDLKFEQYVWVVGDKFYVLTFSSEKGMYNIYKETAQRILNSFKIK